MNEEKKRKGRGEQNNSLKNVAPTIHALGLFHCHNTPGTDRAELLQVGVRAGSCQLGQEAKVLKN